MAVTGAAGRVGRRILLSLADHPDVEEVVALDVREPPRVGGRVRFERVDIATSDLAPVLGDVDVLVHLAGVVDPIADEALMARVNVEGTRRVLAAAGAVQRVVRISSTTVYGAWPDNPLPMTEDAPLRPNRDFSPAVQGATVEELLREWARAHPDVIVTTLRSAPVVGPGDERLPARLVLGRPALRVLGAAAPVQVVHVDDLGAALVLAATRDLPGTYNVAADGWVDAADARRIVGHRGAPALPPEVLRRVLRRTWAVGVAEVPPGVVPYLVHPWVVDTTLLRAHGWAPDFTNEGALAAATTGDTRGGDGTGRRTRALTLSAVVAGTAVAVGLGSRRRSRRQRG